MKKNTSPARAPSRVPSRPKTLPREVRIIGGLYKRSKLPVADKPGLRPTPDRVRETLFNWLAHVSGEDLAGWRCVDAFAGTGALGFEAASRGATQVLLVEQDPALVAQLKATQLRLQASAVQVVRGDGLSVLRSQPAGQTRLVFLDPPFDAPVFEAALKAATITLSADGWLYLEAPKAWQDEDLAEYGLTVYRYLKAGAVHAHLLQRTS